MKNILLFLVLSVKSLSFAGEVEEKEVSIRDISMAIENLFLEYQQEIETAGLRLIYNEEQLPEAYNNIPEIVMIANQFNDEQESICLSVSQLPNELLSPSDNKKLAFAKLFCDTRGVSDPLIFFIAGLKVSKKSSTVEFTTTVWRETAESMRPCTNIQFPMGYVCLFIPPLGVWDFVFTRPFSFVLTGGAAVAGVVAEPFYGWHKPKQIIGVRASLIWPDQKFSDLLPLAEKKIDVPANTSTKLIKTKLVFVSEE